jgi:hypothetical protein
VDDAPVTFFFDEEMLEGLFGADYLETVVKTWTQPGTFERVADDVAREIAAGRASLHGQGTTSDPYTVEVR